MKKRAALDERLLNKDKNKTCKEGKMNESCLFHVYQLLGRRNYQEDFWSSFRISDGVYFHAVYDGHGGTFVAKEVLKSMKKEMMLNVDQFDQKLLNDEESVRNMIVSIFHKVDEEVFSGVHLGVGCTCSAVLTVCALNLIYFIQLGDSRVMLMGLKNGVLFETKDHKPNFPHETNRINAAGGYVVSGYPGPHRVNGILAVSRAFGDWGIERDILRIGNGIRSYVYPNSCKTNKCCVSKVPDVTRFSLEEHKEEKICLVICSDGLTDKLSSAAIYENLKETETGTFRTEKFEKILAEEVFEDNVTAIVIVQNLN